MNLIENNFILVFNENQKSEQFNFERTENNIEISGTREDIIET